MKLWHILTIIVPFIASSTEDINISKEQCKISDPKVYNFKMNVPRKMEISDKWFKNHPSYLNHTKDSFAEFIGKHFNKFLATVASGIPNFVEIPNIQLRPASKAVTNATKGEIWNLREILAGPYNATVYTDWSGKTLAIKFVLQLSGIQVKYRVNSMLPRFDDDVIWELYEGSAVVALMRVTPTGNCPVKFEENEVETSFTFSQLSKGGREQLAHLTVLFKCYIHFIVEQAVYSALKQLWLVLKRMICFSVKQIARSAVDSSSDL